ncbi:hypothetical protein CC78DRAFT_130515 [Lojkania enalia]|uniref:Uncharacterized protein n=1 Tax=Lojkania enalia TaxID=147567 RepID=A0A9P4TQ36_9PLEO|nr:hypothetical protein CC78DRAFT_130515 [Didymosphaeria enalia]
MPALTIPSPTDTGPASPADTSSHSDRSDRKRSESGSPGRPPVSPLTPTDSVAHLVPLEPAEPRTHVAPPQVAAFRQQPPAVSISESENPDAIALRSAISLLQLQREKSKRDLKTLEELKSAAVSDPQAFVRSLRAQQAQKSQSSPDPLAPTLSDISSKVLEADGEHHNGAGRKDSAAIDTPAPDAGSSTKFSNIPQPQNIIRCPPVNWAKYHIVAEPLDKMHEEQRQYPGATEPPRTAQGMRAPPHAVAAPYSPFTDGAVDTQSRRGSKKAPL